MRRRTHCNDGSNQFPQEHKNFRKNTKMRTAMTDLLLENVKLVLLFVWIAAVIALSYVGQPARAKRQSRRRSMPSSR
jgi:hypothetical protein